MPTKKPKAKKRKSSTRVMSTSERYGGRIVKDKKVRGLAGREPFVKPAADVEEGSEG
jgi:hypothetical protein